MTPAQVFSSTFCIFLKNTYFMEHLLAPVSLLAIEAHSNLQHCILSDQEEDKGDLPSYEDISGSGRPEVFCKKGVLKIQREKPVPEHNLQLY